MGRTGRDTAIPWDIEPGVVGAGEEGAADACLRAHGFVTVRGLFDEVALGAIEAECSAAQRDLEAGRLPERYGTRVLTGGAGTPDRAEPIANYVTHVTELSPAAHAAVTHPTIVALAHRRLGPDAWLLDDTRFGVVWQDARAGAGSDYSRIGWHSDWQSGPDLDVWPSVAVTIHLDETSPANGFLRVVPGSHRWATPAPFENVNGAVVPPGSRPAGGYTDEPPPRPMPLRFEKVPGEIALYAERGDVLLHDAYLWHAAARATVDGARRRHLRAGWYSGAGRLPAETVDRFVKNAAR